jgi:methylenetetrahydrofolate reductase (NADPH)
MTAAAVAGRARDLAASASVEVTPRDAARAGALDGLLPQGASVYITQLPNTAPDDIVAAAVAIRRAGYAPVPHIAVRGLPSLEAVDGLIGRLAGEAGVDDVLVIGGSYRTAAGSLTESLDVLRSGILERHGIRRAGVAGHPEGSPDIAPDAVARALREKNAFAESAPFELRIVTQFALAPDPYVAWERAIREAGNRLPVHAGLPGVTSPPRLLKFALACGIGASVEVFRKQSGGLLKLATTRLWKPDAVIDGIARASVDDPESLFRGVHLYAFGGLDETAGWLADRRADTAALRA